MSKHRGTKWHGHRCPNWSQSRVCQLVHLHHCCAEARKQLRGAELRSQKWRKPLLKAPPTWGIFWIWLLGKQGIQVQDNIPGRLHFPRIVMAISSTPPLLYNVTLPLLPLRGGVPVPHLKSGRACDCVNREINFWVFWNTGTRSPEPPRTSSN